MAKSAAYRWQNERKRGLLDPDPGKKKPKKRRRKRGITNKQAAYLASLQRELGVPYTGNGMTVGEASDEIDRMKRRVLTEQERLDGGMDDALERDEAA